jgi:hypothetical protein
MERIQVLIEKLQQQYKQNESAGSMLVTLQLLQNELNAVQNHTKVLGTSKVAVVMPNLPAFNRNFEEHVKADTYKKEEFYSPAEIKLQPKPMEQVTEVLPQMPVEAPQQPNFTHNVPLFDLHVDAVVEAPTLSQQKIHKEVNELIANNKESLNDRLKQEQKEIAHILKDSPIKDLRKGIGLNDKFHILAEAEYWMNRELKVKLGWNDLNETVQHFYQLVRRRFS